MRKCDSSRNWSAGCGEPYLSGAGSAGRNSTAERQHGRRPSTPWVQRQEALLRDCVVPPHVFDHLVDHLRDFVVPYPHALETGPSRDKGLTRVVSLATMRPQHAGPVAAGDARPPDAPDRAALSLPPRTAPMAHHGGTRPSSAALSYWPPSLLAL